MNLSHDTRVLVTGASGALGWSLASRLPALSSVTGTYCSHNCVPGGAAPVRMDLADAGSVDRVMETCRPHVLIHAAAMTDPDACERDPAVARAVNLEGSARLARLAARLGAFALFISTDLVFAGERGNYAETDEARPLSVYGRTKLAAEQAFLAEGGAVVRSSLIYGWGGGAAGTFFTRLHAALESGSGMRLFTDQMRNPVLQDDIARAVLLAVESGLKGLYHVGGRDPVSRMEFGKAVCEVFGFDEGLLEPTSMSDFEYVAARPRDCTLDTSRFSAATGFMPLGVKEGLMRLKAARPG